MKKIFKIVIGVAAVAGTIAGGLYVAKKYFGFGEDKDEIDYDDEEFEDLFDEESDDREYVTLDIDDEIDKDIEEFDGDKDSAESSSDEKKDED